MASIDPDSPATIAAPSQTLIDALCRREHANCFACRSRERGGLGLVFRAEKDSACSEWIGPRDFESYEGILHGGILATVLDSAMVHALFAYGIVARTGHFELRYRRSVLSGTPLSIRARVVGHHNPLYVMTASIAQNGEVCVEAKAKFMATARYAEKDLHEDHA